MKTQLLDASVVAEKAAAWRALVHKASPTPTPESVGVYLVSSPGLPESDGGIRPVALVALDALDARLRYVLLTGDQPYTLHAEPILWLGALDVVVQAV